MLNIASNRKVLNEQRQKTILSNGEVQTAEQIAKRQDILTSYRNQQFYGIIPCKSKLGTYYYLNLNDDNVAEHLLAFGCYGYERATAAIFTKLSKNADIVLDLGSFTGYYSILAGRLGKAKNIVAIEANPLNYQRLKDNIKINGLHVQTFNNALVPTADTHEFIDIKFNSKLRVLDTGGFVDHESNDVANAKKNKLDTYSIKTTSIQKLLNEASCPEISNYILAKIDIEGLEIPITTELFLQHPNQLIAIVEIIFESTFHKFRESIKSARPLIIAYINEEKLTMTNVTACTWHEFRSMGSRNFLICASKTWDDIKSLNIREYLSFAE